MHKTLHKTSITLNKHKHKVQEAGRATGLEQGYSSTRLSPIRFGALIAAFELLSDKFACGRLRQTVAIVGFSGASIGS